MPRDRVCRICQISFTPKKPMQAFCSKSCGVTAYHARQKEKRLRACRACGQAFTPYPSVIRLGFGHYCSRTCRLTYEAQRPDLLTVVCAHCGSSFRRTRAAVVRTHQVYCSTRCLGDAMRQPILAPHEHLNRGAAWQRLAATIRDRDGHICRLCGKTEAEAGERLSVDHIIPWREAPELAADPTNLVSLCRSCHARKTSRAERRWRQRGDALDLQRYQQQLVTPSLVTRASRQIRQQGTAIADGMVVVAIDDLPWTIR